MDQILTDPTRARPLNEATLAAVEIMDHARSRLGIHFPADEKPTHYLEP